MSKCSICHKNEAVIFTTRAIDGDITMEGICLKCAYETGMEGMDEFFNRIGVNDDNVDELTQRFNTMMERLNNRSPEELFSQIMGGDLPNLFADVMHDEGDESEETDETDEDERDDADRPDGDKAKSKPSFRPGSSIAELINASIGGDSAVSGNRSRAQREGKRDSKPRRSKFLEQFSTNLTEQAENGELDRIIGRETELAHVIQILNRRTKNNPALIGEPGVGKTAIAEGLAVKIVSGDVPAKLLDQEVYLLDMTAMVAGTQFRGQFEARMKGVVDDARRAGNVILVIDELHNIMGAGDAEGAMNAANILKPALARGEIRVVGSTTLDEYRRFIEKDSALERRFQKVMVDEPSPEETMEILMGIKDYYEAHHHVIYPPTVLETAIRLSGRYITDRFFPDKAIDLLDEAGSHANLGATCLVQLKKMNQEIDHLKDLQEANETTIRETTEDDKQIELYAEQMELRTKLLRLESARDELQKQCKPIEITDFDIARVVELWTGIPVVRITEEESERLFHLEERLHQRVVGQNEAIDSLARAIRRHRAGFSQKHKPASFLFVGPTGVGKTELVKALGEVMFDTEDAVVRLDMSEFMEAHTVSKLIGSPPGYVGYNDGGQLTEKIRRKPYSVVLFDEIEKAHADVYNILLQILDDGRLTDSHGRVVNFENTIIVMTSNAGTTLKAQGFGFGASGYIAMKDRVDTVLKQLFRPEFLNRIDEIIVFHELSREEIRDIVDLMLKEPKAEMRRRGLTLDLSEAAKDKLAEEGYDPKYGARPLRRLIQRRIEDPLADLWLSGKLNHVQRVHVRLDDETTPEAIQGKTLEVTCDESGRFCLERVKA